MTRTGSERNKKKSKFVIFEQEGAWSVKRQSMEIKPDNADVHTCSQTRVALRCLKNFVILNCRYQV
jgi:hypothetical protein